ncbi:hypothetical protein L6259_02670 [Candidatus Parcubacteria bacterium]|nr:hypothetical protein [Patescibacteria group bacterium]MCG2694149.1 hypothetical protein [Candidatus Parcubacteria bacterium]
MDFDELAEIYSCTLLRMILSLTLFIIICFTHNKEDAIIVSGVVFILCIFGNENENMGLWSVFITIPICAHFCTGAYAPYTPIVLAAGVLVVPVWMAFDNNFHISSGIFALLFYSLQAMCAIVIVKHPSITFALVSLGVLLTPLLIYGLVISFIALIQKYPPAKIQMKTIKYRVDHGGIYRNSVVTMNTLIRETWPQRLHRWLHKKTS